MHIYRVRVAPAYHSVGIEEHIVALAPQRHLAQVVGEVGKPFLGEHMATVTVKAHLIGVLEAHLPEFAVGYLVYTVLGNRDHHPLACSKLRVRGISLGRTTCRSAPLGRRHPVNHQLV